MKKLDEDAVELSYEEYQEKAQQLKGEGWANFKVYPPRAGVTYVWAYNPVLQAHRLITTVEYLTLRDCGAWAKGVDRVRGNYIPETKKVNKVVTKKDPRYAKAVEKLIAMDKKCTTFEEMKSELNKVITFMVTP